MTNSDHKTLLASSSAIKPISPVQIRALPPACEQEFLPPISRWTTFGGMFIILIAGLAIPLASKIEYKIAVKGQSSIRPAGELRFVQAATEGTVTELRVAENQKVKRGDVIAILDRSRLETKKTQLKDNIEQAKLQILQIQAQITAQNDRRLAESDRLSRATISAKAELNHRLREHQDLNITTAAQVEEAQANLQLTVEELQQARTDLVAVTADWKSSKAALSAAISKRDRYQTIANSGALSQNQLEEAKLNVVQLQEQVNGKQAAIQRQRQEITRREQAVAAARARLVNVKAALNPSNAEVAIARSNIAQEKATGQATIANLQREKEALIQQRIEIQNQINRDRTELQQLEKDLEQSVIKATADGTIFQLNLRNTGQAVVAGDKIAQIAPSDASLVVKALIPAKEIGKVDIGQISQTKISACPYPDYGTLTGKVTKIAPDAIALQANTTIAVPQTTMQSSGSVFYEVTIEPETNVLQRHHHQCYLQPGMEGKADVITKKETVLRFLLRKAKLLTDI